MKKSHQHAELKQRIDFLRNKKDQDLMSLKYQYAETLESLKPSNIIKTMVVDFVTAPSLKTQLITGVLGIGKHYLTKNILDKYGNNAVGRFLRRVVTF